MKMQRRPAIDGKIVIVTGASSGIGEATAREFARAGAITVLAARRLKRLERLADEIRQMGGDALPVKTDLTDVDQIANLVHTTLSNFGRIDILANIAGWGLYDWFEELSAEELRMHYDVNIIGMAELTRQVIPVMKSQRSGFILNMSSYVSRISVPPLTVYTSTKYAVEGLTDGLRRALLPWGITVIRIHPSSVSGTEFNQKSTRPGKVEFRPNPIGRISRERLARHIVGLIEKPRHALFISRLYEVPVLLNKLFPEFVDWISQDWVRRKRKNEIPPEEAVTPVQYSSSFSLWPWLGGILVVGLITRLWRKKP
ncbi:MAG TPA: SDR family oxidoreductase [Anaerolineales bacterium]|nr:SDR family oxidoreductase [Anaerolineales bacterium]